MNIDDLISQYIDGELPPEAEAELHHRLSISDDDRRIFREQIMLTGLARDARVLDRPAPSLRSALFTRLHRDEGLNAGAIPHGTAFAHLAAPVPGATDRRVSPSRRRRMIAVLLPLLIAAIGTSLVLMLDEDPTDFAPIAGDYSSGVDEAAGTRGGVPLADGGEALAVRPEPEPGDATDREPSRVRGDRGSSAATGNGSTRERRDDALAMTLGEAASAESSPSATSSAPEARAFGGADVERSPDRGAPPSEPLAVTIPPVAAQSHSLVPAPLRPRGGTTPPAAAAATESARSELAAGAPAETRALGAADSASNAKSVATISAIEPSRSHVEDRRSGLALMSGIQQHVLIGMEDDQLRPELTMRLGGSFADGGHSVFGIVGYAGYSETTTQSRLRLQANVYRGTDSLTEDTQSIDDHGELWGGAGYRYTAKLSERWRVGAGAWAGFGQRFSRVAAELPIAYVLGRSVSLELTPSVVYVTARENATRETAYERVATPDAIVVQTETVAVPGNEFRAGIGLGITITFD